MRILVLFSLIFFCFNCSTEPKSSTVEPKEISTLAQWLAIDFKDRPPLEETPFADTPLSKAEANRAMEELIDDYQKTLDASYGNQWTRRVLELGNLQMPFYYKRFGTPPSDGSALYISLHGGGGTTADVNDQQYNNQKNLYDQTMLGLEGIYLATRAPTNTWNMWHQDHIDDFLDILISMAVAREGVNPNKVYLLGYSAGGDGVYQLAPRMADRWAAAAMMAGHPNDASPLGLKNTAFALHMGALDSSYDRNLKAQEWKNILEQLQSNAPGSYIHDVQIHEGLGHWMNLQDAVALPWMSNYSRNNLPENVVWKQDDRHHSRFYWLGVPKDQAQTGGEIKATFSRDTNTVNIISNYSSTLFIYLNDAMLDLDQPVSIQYQGNEIAKKVFDRTNSALYNSLHERGDIGLMYAVKINLNQNSSIVD